MTLGSGPAEPALGEPGADTANKLLTPGEAATVLGVDPRTVGRWAREGRIAAERTPGGHRRFADAEVARLARGGQA